MVVDCVLTDLGMPDMTGWELARAIKSRRPACPVILLTGWQDQAPGDDTDREWVDAILGKPVRFGDLIHTLTDVTQGRHSGHSE